MSTKTARNVSFTYDDFCALVHEDQKADLIDGVIYMASPENIYANELFVWLVSLWSGFASRRKLGKVFGSRVACRLDDRNAPEPDIVFVAKRNFHRLHRGGIRGAPDAAVEIVSPDSVERDYVKKREQFQRFGIPEYWIIDQLEEKVLRLGLDKSGKYREVRPRKGKLHSVAMPGFWLDPRWLWQEPLPDIVEALEQILESN